jgi:hypothetical protein
VLDCEERRWRSTNIPKWQKGSPTGQYIYSFLGVYPRQRYMFMSLAHGHNATARFLTTDIILPFVDDRISAVLFIAFSPGKCRLLESGSLLCLTALIVESIAVICLPWITNLRSLFLLIRSIVSLSLWKRLVLAKRLSPRKNRVDVEARSGEMLYAVDSLSVLCHARLRDHGINSYIAYCCCAT